MTLVSVGTVHDAFATAAQRAMAASEATRMLPIILLLERSDEVARLRGFSAGAMVFSPSPSRRLS
jgi:hypothetical protein